MEIQLYGKIEDLERLLKDLSWEVEETQGNLSASHPHDNKLGVDAAYDEFSGKIICNISKEGHVFYTRNIRPKLWTYNLVEASEIKERKPKIYSQKQVRSFWVIILFLVLLGLFFVFISFYL